VADIVIIGGGGHARVLLELLRVLDHRVAGYTAPARTDLGLPWLGTDDDLMVRPGTLRAALGIGKNDGGDRRQALQERLESVGIGFPSLVAPSATVHDDVGLGAGTVVLSGAVVVTGSHLGRCCIVNTNASVDHDCDLGDDVHVGPGATLCGGVRIAPHTLIAAGATVVPGISIGRGVVVAAGATVTRPIVDPGLYAGTPARRIH
jgi:sugar O-acyltransferase (sialic acid O-acetyltransferase NeuD family)